MSNDLPRLSRGSVGDVRFDHMNRVMQATAAVEGLSEGGPGSKPIILRGFFAKLLADSGSNVGSYNLWTWQKVSVDSSSASIVPATGALASSQYANGGKAIDIAGTAAVNQIAFIYEMMGMDNVRYYAIVSSGGSVSGGAALSINGGSGDPAVAPIEYSVSEGTIDASGSFVPSGQTGTMWNLYEFDPYGHGQGLSFAQGTLTPTALDGIVFGSYSMTDGSDRVYICDVPNPMEPICEEATDDALPMYYDSYSVMRAGL